ncbi:hypothetical protein [Streptomyces antimicrobicus]|uniref:Uncharacterized protein n=1 Tax=Streptomyces antimicrobicus TaxID=2883108 RepID=A0ABS8B0E8_9ACTN|nr:hypothetical protein [Streptomyces antimicrobicus]MCB5178054.1 hypothetical protein [Streptomyces antimicrobicus]
MSPPPRYEVMECSISSLQRYTQGWMKSRSSGAGRSTPALFTAWSARQRPRTRSREAGS